MQSWYVGAAVFLIAEAPLAALLSFRDSIAPMLLCLVGYSFTFVFGYRHYRRFRILARADRESSSGGG